MKQAGFTLVEVLVTLSITLILTTVMITYSRSGEQQILLFKEQAKIINVISRAKSLALQTFQSGANFCGYGVHFNADGTFILFRDVANDCAASDNVYSGPAEQVESYKLDARVRFSQVGFFDIIFIPPDPQVRLNPDQFEADIQVQAVGGTVAVGVHVTNAGQVTSAVQ
ncbi:MAG TPA: prepilin-type N-terminal cleavage/methylation domain-containing protein [Candidatus Paceibacterota bacterium]